MNPLHDKAREQILAELTEHLDSLLAQRLSGSMPKAGEAPVDQPEVQPTPVLGEGKSASLAPTTEGENPDDLARLQELYDSIKG